jgi:cysteine desulfuration protein SufE
MTAERTIGEAQEALQEEFALFDEWRDKIEYVIDLGRHLPPMPDAEKIEANKVRGCQSQVWMVAELDEETGRLRLRADSDAFIVKGLIGILLRLYGDRTPQEIIGNPPTVFDAIGLGKHLTPGRSNGLWSMISRIRHLAEGYASAAALAD